MFIYIVLMTCGVLFYYRCFQEQLHNFYFLINKLLTIFHYTYLYEAAISNAAHSKKQKGYLMKKINKSVAFAVMFAIAASGYSAPASAKLNLGGAIKSISKSSKSATKAVKKVKQVKQKVAKVKKAVTPKPVKQKVVKVKAPKPSKNKSK